MGDQNIMPKRRECKIIILNWIQLKVELIILNLNLNVFIGISKTNMIVHAFCLNKLEVYRSKIDWRNVKQDVKLQNDLRTYFL